MTRWGEAARHAWAQRSSWISQGLSADDIQPALDPLRLWNNEDTGFPELAYVKDRAGCRVSRIPGLVCIRNPWLAMFNRHDAFDNGMPRAMDAQTGQGRSNVNSSFKSPRGAPAKR